MFLAIFRARCANVPRAIGVTRPNFLTLTLVCVALAAAVSLQQGSSLRWLDVALVTLIALAAHISVNAFNEYFDFKSGLDFTTRPTPFSGGSGTLVQAPELAGVALWIAVLSLILVIAGGLWLAWQHGWPLLALGGLGVLVIYTYTQYLNRSPLLCLLAPGIGFGLCMTLGAGWVFSGQLSVALWVAALVVTLLVSNLLLLNQFPDIEADKASGRRHLPIVWGAERAAQVFVVFYALVYATLITAAAMQLISSWSLLALLTLGLAWPLVTRVLKAPNRVASEVGLLGLNVAVVHLLPLLLGVGMLVGWLTER